MKKNVLALSITAAVLGMVGGAQAMTAAPLVGAKTGSTLVLNEAGVGHSLFVPYFTAQDTNSTLINLVNTDRINGKAVKIRFRGAANSDDLYDFQVFLSPGDVWTASVSKGANGYAKLTTNDASCTKPSKAVLNSQAFQSTRLDTANLTGDALQAGTREGYVEIFNMADIPPTALAGVVVAGSVTNTAGATDHFPEYTYIGAANTYGPGAATLVGYSGDLATGSAAFPLVNTGARNAAGGGTTVAGVTNTTNALFTAIKHVNKVAPCAAASGAVTDVFAALDTADQADVLTANAAGMLPPTSGLMANWTIINVVGAAAWSGQATAVRSILPGTTFSTTGNLIYWPQTGSNATTPESFTADPLLRNDSQKATASGAVTTTVAGGAAAITALFVDLPDMSTPYSAAAGVGAVAPGATNYLIAAATSPAAGQPLNQAQQLTSALATRSITNEFLTDPAISASTDMVFSFPTKRYSTAFNYAAVISAVPATYEDGRRFSEIVDDGAIAGITAGYFGPSNTVVNQVSATNVNGRQICVTGISGPLPYDREETTFSAPTSVVVSPAPVTPTTSFCGEASVMSINDSATSNPTAALKSTVTRNNRTLPVIDGWIVMGTPGISAAVAGLPVIGGAFVKAVGGSSTFGATYSHRYVR